MVDSDGSTRKSHEGVARDYLAPGITRDKIHVIIVLEITLLDSIFQAVEERGAIGALSYLLLIAAGKRRGFHLVAAGREYEAFALSRGTSN